jgi:DNA-binding FadR family transcriptional regulator
MGVTHVLLTLREQHILRASGNRVLRKIFALKKDVLTTELRNEEFHNLYSSPNIIRTINKQ